jgi:hypothetical protein
VTNQKDTVIRRLVVEYGNWYVYVYVVDGNGKLVQEEVFKQPFRLEHKEVHEEAGDCFHQVYQWILDTTVFPEKDSASDDDKPPK